LAAHDTDSFNRWEAAQTLGENAVKDFYTNMDNNSASCELSASFVDALRRILTGKETKDRACICTHLACGVYIDGGHGASHRSDKLA